VEVADNLVKHGANLAILCHFKSACHALVKSLAKAGEVDFQINDPSSDDLDDRPESLEFEFHHLSHIGDQLGLLTGFPTVLHEQGLCLTLLDSDILSVEDSLPQILIQDGDSLQQFDTSLLLASEFRVLLAEAIEIIAEIVDPLLVACITTDKRNEVLLSLSEKAENALPLLTQVIEALQRFAVVEVHSFLPFVDLLLVADFVTLLVLASAS